MSNRNNRRADRVEAIRLACRYLVYIAEPTATGATLFLWDGCALDLSVDDARALHGYETPTLLFRLVALDDYRGDQGAHSAAAALGSLLVPLNYHRRHPPGDYRGRRRLQALASVLLGTPVAGELHEVAACVARQSG
jgi:hypothetical protein